MKNNAITFNLPDNILKADFFRVQGWKDQNKQKLPLMCAFFPFFPF